MLQPQPLVVRMSTIDCPEEIYSEFERVLPSNLFQDTYPPPNLKNIQSKQVMAAQTFQGASMTPPRPPSTCKRGGYQRLG